MRIKFVLFFFDLRLICHVNVKKWAMPAYITGLFVIVKYVLFPFVPRTYGSVSLLTT